MAFKRTAFKRRRRPLIRRKRAIAKVGRMIKSAGNHFFKRSYMSSYSTSGGYLGRAETFRLDMLPNYTEFSNLFDQYRINMVVCKLIHRGNSLSMIESNNNNLAGLPIVYDVIDLDDATAAGSKTDILQYSKHHMNTLTANRRIITRRIYPRTLNTIYRTGVTSAYALNNRKQWLDMAQLDIPHYGWKYWIEVPQSTGTIVNANFDFMVTVYFQCRQAR